MLGHVAPGHAWEWHAHLDVWLVVVGLVAGYIAAIRVLGPRFVPAGSRLVTRSQVRAFVLAVLFLEVAADWPLHDLGENFLFSAHMVQHTLLSLVVPPLLLVALPDWLLGWLTSAPSVGAIVRRIARPVPATLLFNGFIAISHWPAWVNGTLENHAFHFVAHALLFGVALVMWLPVVNRRADLPRLSPPLKMLYLFVQSIVPTVPASFLAFAERPIYRFYAEAARPFSMTAVEDQQVAGGVMKVGGAAIIWGVIVVIFFRWYASSQRDKGGDVLTWEDVERELERAKPVAR